MTCAGNNLMKQFLLNLVFFTTLSVSNAAYASAWLHCSVQAQVVKTDETSFEIKVLSGTVLEGHQDTGTPCLDEGASYTIENADYELAEGQDLMLDYNYYSGMGPDGVVSSTQWQIIEPPIE